MPTSLINGEANTVISSHDRGLLYGDGLFETMAVVAGQIPLWSLHLARLQRGCERLRLPCPSVELLQHDIAQLTDGIDRAVIKLILTRGSGGRGYLAPNEPQLTRILQRHAWPDMPRTYWESGVKLIYCQQVLARQPALAGIKHLNRLEQVLARAEWDDPTIQEGLLADTQGDIIEAVSHNLFILRQDTLVTPDLNQCGVTGVMREYILTLLKDRAVPVQVAGLTRQDVLSADAVFLCNSVHGIWPVCDIEGKHYPLNPLVCDLRDSVAKVIPYP